MAITKERVLSFLYSKTMRAELLSIALGLIDPTTKLQLTYQGNCSSAYTKMTGPDKDVFKVVIGGAMVAQSAMMPDSFSTKDTLKPFVGPAKASFKALMYHELGHVLFTDMTFEELLKYDTKYHGFIFQLFNILEDPVVELMISKYVETIRPYDRSPRAYINYIKKQLFSLQCKDYKDAGNIETFLQYLLLLVRCGKDAIASTNAVFEKYKKDIVPMIKEILCESNQTLRQTKTVHLADWMIKNVKEFKWEGIAAPEDMKPSLGGRSRGTTVPIPSGAKPSLSDIPDMGDGGDGDAVGSCATSDGAEEEPSKTDKKESISKEYDTDEEKKSKDAKDGDGKEDPPEVREAPTFSDEESMDECFNDLLNASFSHEFVIAKDEYTISDPKRLDEEIEKQLDVTKDSVHDMAKFLATFNGRKKPRMTRGFTSGKLNIRAAMQDEARDGCDIHLFDRHVPRGKMADLAVSLVCDNSGSMCGRRSTLASIAALALGQACDWANIPFECSCFTKTCDSSSGTSITIIEKAFGDSFEKSKPYFGINDSDLVNLLHSERHIPTFCGNSEEVNLFHIGNAFARCNHQTKLMFVFCDGATTGSTHSLREVVKLMESNGIYVIGIGIMENKVESIYSHHKVFKTLEDMRNNLAPYLIETLSEFVMK